MNEVQREMTFEEEATLYEQEAREIFAKEKPGVEAPAINSVIRRGVRIIRKAREELHVKHGEWIKKSSEEAETLALCSRCGYPISWWYKSNFCPNCGAKMKGVSDER